MSDINLGIVGTSIIAEEHIKVIQSIKKLRLYGITSRSNKRSNKLKKKYNFLKVYRNYNEMVNDENIDAVIIVVSSDNNYKVLSDIIPSKKPFFTEKPVGMNLSEHEKILKLTKKYKNLNLVGFNRRHYSIFHKALRIFEKNGGLISFSIEGHERFWQKNNLKHNLKKNWHHLNSIHTIDLINFFGGNYSKYYLVSKKTNLTKNDQISSIFKFKNDILGTYQSYWHSPGGWSVKLFGDGITSIFQPLEKGLLINKNFREKLIIPSKYDIMYKPGFYNQMISFKNLILSSKLEWPSLSINSSIISSKLANRLANE